MDQIFAAVTEHLVGAAATVDVVVAGTAADQVGSSASVDLVAAATTVDLGTSLAIMDDVVHAFTAEQERPVAALSRGQVVVARIAVQPGGPDTVIDEHVVAIAAVELDIRRDSLLDVDMVIPVTAEGDQLLDALEDGFAPAEDHAQRFTAGIRAEMLDGVQLVAFAFADAADVVAGTHVEVEHAVGVGRVPDAGVACRVAGQVDLLRQFDVADGEAHRHADPDEQDLDRGICACHQRHPALARCRDAGADVDPGEGDAEGPQPGTAGELDQEIVLGEPRGGGHFAFAEGDPEMQVGDQPETAGAEYKFPVERYVEITLVVEHARGLHRHQAEEVHAGTERDPP